MRGVEQSSTRMQVPGPGRLGLGPSCQKSSYQARTADGWTLVLTRYQPLPQRPAQPLLGEPLLLVHGFSQNRRAWEAGDFVGQMLAFGVDVHVLELRGHGLSSIELQHERAAQGMPLPADIDYGWDIDSYLLFDLPAAVAAVKRASGREEIILCGYSMGGMLGYGYASLYDDLAGLVAIGAPAELGRGFPLLKVLAYLAPAAWLVDGCLLAHGSLQRALRGPARALSQALPGNCLARRLTGAMASARAPQYRYVPVDLIARKTERLLAGNDRLLARLWPHLGFMPSLERTRAQDVRWLLREAGERESRGVIEQFARWIRNDEMICYRTGYDLRAGFSRIRAPVAIIFGDLDKLASAESTRSVYSRARSDYLLWRPIRGSSHVELAIGQNTRQICFDIKSLMDFARQRSAQHRPPGPARSRNALRPNA